MLLIISIFILYCFIKTIKGLKNVLIEMVEDIQEILNGIKTTLIKK